MFNSNYNMCVNKKNYYFTLVYRILLQQFVNINQVIITLNLVYARHKLF